jgi:hypothetical protein
MCAASSVCWLAVSGVAGRQTIGAALLGMIGPLGAAVATWVIVHRTYVRAPERTSAAMIKLFAAKLLFFGAYVTAVVMSLRAGTMVFVASFVSQYILLHVMEAIFLRRLFSTSPVN